MGVYPSIFQAEVYAISLCAEINLRRNYRNESILIMSDSQAALKALLSFEVKSSLALECIHKLNALAEYNDIQLTWVPGHVGVVGNEEADQLARKAAASLPIGPEPFIAIGPSTIKEELRKERNT
ncbi:PREDICTED: ribonuclease H-like, partial [Rhagoletis zephyria]|uniref:ribonuclease H-like n=1 Tax=Rhagoletis zephyria TaxID=28612 RepID=UPI000811722D